ncbi:helix-turn-helix transcriptional regulator [Chitinibacter bivalviorum]|uniref:Helix-turn-helix transcriptional regulator n=1 Tax=Chitinibacter bivalviorum TaxID=2739434 RepID=A0A7H9BJT4_9NEIS|nr:helix-turn-helix transcriptional regulator [Chitinibacter bivalviorum]QLG88843.1 helix-turn-helix transcriptional regulator [Chitinibacter bivalviorum]
MSNFEYGVPERRIHSLINRLEMRLAEPIRLDELARQACYSVHHFDRVFGDHVGQTPMDYLRRRRLQRACMRVRYEKTAITQIAHATGFSSDSAFAKTFKQYFGYSARDWRQGAWRSYMDSTAVVSNQVNAELMQQADAWYASREPFRIDVAQRIQVRELATSQYLYRSWRLMLGWAQIGAAVDQTIADGEKLGLGGLQCVWLEREDGGLIRVDHRLCEFGFIIDPRSELVSRDFPDFIRGQIAGGLYACLPYVNEMPLSRWMHEDWLEQQSVYVFDGRRPYIELSKCIDGQIIGQLLMPIQRAC